MLTPRDDRLVVDEFDFQVPCRRFTVRATVTREQQLPVVDEFVLRLLAILDRVPLSRIRTFFGFNAAETDTVILDLERRKLVELQDEDLVLAPAGMELFKTVAEGDVPRIVEVAPMHETIWFDLVSRNILQPTRRREVAYLPTLEAQTSARDLPASFARRAFEANFRDYVRRVRRLPDADSINLYSISDVASGTFGFQSFGVAFEADASKPSVMRLTFPALADEHMRYRLLTVAVTDAWRRLDPPEEAAAALAEYARATGDPRSLVLRDRMADGSVWGDAATTSPTAGFAPSVGATYLARNVGLLVDAVAQAPPVDAGGTLEVLWMRPVGTMWGRTLRLANAIQEIRDAVRNAGGPDLSFVLLLPRAVPRASRRECRRLFEKGWLLPRGHLPGSLELLLVPGAAALASVHLEAGGGAFPVGGVVRDPMRLARIGEMLGSAADGSERLWSRTGSGDRADGDE